MSQQLLIYTPVVAKPNHGERQCKIQEEKEKATQGSPAPLKSTPQSCAMPHADEEKKKTKEEQKKEEQCKYASAVLEIEGKSPVTLSDKATVLKIIAGDTSKFKSVKCSIKGGVGPCNGHKEKIFDFGPSPDLIESTNESLQFKARSIPFYKIFENGFTTPWETKKAGYKFSANTCGKKASAELMVFPDVEFNIDIPFEYTRSEEHSRTPSRTRQTIRVSVEEKEEMKFEASYKEDGKTYTVSKEIINTYEKVNELVKVAKKVKRTFDDALDNTVVIDMKLPAGKLHFDFKYAEYGHFEVDAEWNLLLKLTPLFGGSFVVNLDEAAMMVANQALGQLYKKIKKLVQKYGDMLTLEVEYNNSFDLDIGFKKHAGGKPVKSGAGLTGKAEIDLRMKGDFKIQKIIRAEVSFQGGAKSGVEATMFVYSKDNAISMDYEVKQLALVVYYEVKITGDFIRKVPVSKRNEYEPLDWWQEETLFQGTLSW